MKLQIQELLILLHASGMISIIAGSAVQITNSLKTINKLQLIGSMLMLVTGVLLAIYSANEIAAEAYIQVKLFIKLMLAVSICIISFRGVRRRLWRTGFYTISTLTLVNIFIAIAWG